MAGYASRVARVRAARVVAPGGQAPSTSPARTAAAAGTALSTRSSRKALPPEIAAQIRHTADAATALHRERLVEKAEAAYGA